MIKIDGGVIKVDGGVPMPFLVQRVTYHSGVREAVSDR